MRPIVRPLSVQDLEGALQLSVTAGWNQRQEDWRMLLRLAPAGSFCTVDGGRIVGTAIGIDYGGFGWIAMMLVDPAYRGRGLGARLLEASMAAIPSGKPIRLDATPLGRPLYERYGFQLESELTRHVRDTPEPLPIRSSEAGAGTSGMRRVSGSHLASILDCDLSTFLGDRGPVLEWALADAPDYAQCCGGSGEALQYCFGRHGRLFDQIGPVVARSARMAATLAGASLAAAAGRMVAIDAFNAQAEFTGWLCDHGFQPQRPLFRMCRGNAPIVRERGDVAEFAIFGPEFG